MKSKARALKQQHREQVLATYERERDSEKPPAGLFQLPQQMPLCKRGYYSSMDRCMANCGMQSGKCVKVGDGGVGVVACMCETGEL